MLLEKKGIVLNTKLISDLKNKIISIQMIKNIIFAYNKILSIKINIYNIFYLIIFLLPLIQTELRIRIGAGWQLYIPFIFLLFVVILKKRKKSFYNYGLTTLILLMFTLLSDIFGYFEYKDFSLSESLMQQIHTIEARMLVENVRFIASILFLIITLYLLKSYQLLLKSLKTFLYASLFQAVYGIYEFVSKISLHFLPLLNKKGYSHGTTRLFGTFFEPSQYGQFMLISILSLILYSSLNNKFSQYIKSDFFIKNYKKILFLFFVTYLLSLSRAAFLIGFVVLIIYFLSSITSIKRLFRLMIFLSFVSLSFYIYLSSVLSQTEYKNWTYLLTSDTGNGLIARIYLIFNYFNSITHYIFSHPFGIGNGLAIVENGMLPFFFRLPMESGLIIFLFYLLFIFLILLRNTIYTKNKSIKLNIFMLLIGILIAQFNYSSTNDPWIWFLLALLYRIPKLTRRNKL